MQEDIVSNNSQINAKQFSPSPAYEKSNSNIFLRILRVLRFLFITSFIGSILGYTVGIFVIPGSVGLLGITAMLVLIIFYSGIVAVVAAVTLQVLKLLRGRVPLTRKSKFLICLPGIILILLSAAVPIYLAWPRFERERKQSETDIRRQTVINHIMNSMPKFNSNDFENCKGIRKFLNEENIIVPDSENHSNYLTQAWGFECEGVISYNYPEAVKVGSSSNEFEINVVPFSYYIIYLIYSYGFTKEVVTDALIYVDDNPKPISINAPISDGKHSFKLLYKPSKKDLENLEGIRVPQWSFGLDYKFGIGVMQHKSNLFGIKEPLNLSLRSSFK